jgi:hypothetical protein
MELVKSDRYIPQSGQGIVNEISTNTGKPLVTTEEEFASRRGLMSKLEQVFPQLKVDPETGLVPEDQIQRLVMGLAWQKGVDPSTKLGILKGLSTDIQNLPKGEINPTVLRNHYKALHKLPTDMITENVDRLEFVPKITEGGKQSYIPGKKYNYTWGDHHYEPRSGTSDIRLNPGTSELAHPTQVATIEQASKHSRTPIHEVTHAATINPDNLLNVPDPRARVYMRDLIRSSEKTPYAEKPTERIARDMEGWQRRKEAWGKRITNEDFKSQLTDSIRQEAIIDEVKSMRGKKVKDYSKDLFDYK